jgi:hypothetical protein
MPEPKGSRHGTTRVHPLLRRPQGPHLGDDLFQNPHLAEALSREVGIEWIADLAGLDYVRQAAVITHARKGYLRCPTAPECLCHNPIIVVIMTFRLGS